MTPQTLYAVTSLVSVFRSGSAIELAGRPWARDEHLFDGHLGTADQLALRAAGLAGGRVVTMAAVRALLPSIECFLSQGNGLGWRLVDRKQPDSRHRQ